MNKLPDLELKIQAEIDKIHAVANLLPGVTIIHRMPDFKLEYMSQNGLNQLGITLAELRSYSTPDYTAKYFNPEDAETYVPKVKDMVERNTDNDITFFQQVKINNSPDWVWHLSTMKILMRDDEGLPLLVINMAFKVDPIQHVTAKVERMLEENIFLRKNFGKFSNLTKRECEILRLMVLGKSSPEIASQLFIAAGTVDTHRKNIKHKLGANSSFELSQYARAFDLI
ncbi:response regulator transcription factor [Mucilaginibacter sp. OK283]|jgi:DNA-binding CsgD family transcriptional regulator|uniref:response regulator transcription factor n=1 Tax=Mucilaginibacter sp. OK283 TaxID=1881049 RepID=UPI0008D588FF|nr:helix-turn-helix transcriptional regulator [Mucilaginibacter sp. OK283]SEP44472.1 regulatory protein, luxR family [Mucilaginibacter sp. OK283]